MKVKQAFQLIDQDYYVLQENGDLLPQTTRAGAIENGLRMLDVQKGQRVLEIGTGSGYSSALLALLVGDTGQVVSVDIDPKLTQRAQHKLSAYPWVTCVTGDGRKGCEFSAPYDRIIAWTTPDHFPGTWKNQLKEAGFIVAPFRVLDIVQCTVMVRFKHVDRSLLGDLVRPEGYIPMTFKPVVDFDLFGPETQADVVGEGDEPFWVGAYWMKVEGANEEWNQKFLQAKSESSPFQESGQDIRAYLLGKQPDGFAFAFRPEDGDWIGYSTPTGFALASYRQPNRWIISDSEHAEVLHKWWSNWEQLGKPSYEQLQPFIENDQVKVRLKGGV